MIDPCNLLKAISAVNPDNTFLENKKLYALMIVHFLLRCQTMFLAPEGCYHVD